MNALVLLIVMALVACGKDESKGSSPAPTQDPTATDQSALEGVPGAQGPKGDKGDKGDTGAQGAAGRPVDTNEWIDPATGALWFFGPAQAYDPKACNGNGYALPTLAQLATAKTHGLFIAAAPIGQGDAWASDGSIDYATVPSVLAERAIHGLYCTKIK